MTPKFLAPFLAFTLILTTWPAVKSQTPHADQANQTNYPDWQRLKDLKRGKQILIEYKTNVGGSLECKFVRLAADGLVISDGNTEATINQRDIQRVYRLNGKWSRSTMATIGAGIGMVVGIFIGASRGNRLQQEPGHVNSEKDEVPAIAGFVIGTAGGAGMGALVGGKRKGKLLYEAN